MLSGTGHFRVLVLERIGAERKKRAEQQRNDGKNQWKEDQVHYQPVGSVFLDGTTSA